MRLLFFDRRRTDLVVDNDDDDDDEGCEPRDVEPPRDPLDDVVADDMGGAVVFVDESVNVDEAPLVTLLGAPDK